MTIVLLLVAAVLWSHRTRHRRRTRRPRLSWVSRRRALSAVITVLAFQVVLGMPAAAAQDCGEAPNPERPTAGMVSALDAPRPTHGLPSTVYGQYGYAGQVWHTYDDQCSPLASLGPKSSIDTWTGNQLFNVGKNLVAATNGLHYAIAYDELTGPMDDAIGAASRFFYSNIYTQLISLALLILAIMLFRHIWRGDLATVNRRAFWALAALATASSFLATGPLYKELEQHFLNKITQIQGGFLANDAPEADLHALPQALHERVVYTNWLRGAFGSETAPEAKQYGPELLNAQAWKKYDTTDTVDQTALDDKKATYKEIVGKLGATKGYFTGEEGSRTGAGILSLLQSILYSLFQLLAKLAILLAQVLLRIFILATPVIGLIAIFHNGLLRRIATAAAATVLHVLIIAALAGMHLLLLNAIFAAGDNFPTIATMALAALTTTVFLIIGKPLRRIGNMVQLVTEVAKPRATQKVLAHAGGGGNTTEDLETSPRAELGQGDSGQHRPEAFTTPYTPSAADRSAYGPLASERGPEGEPVYRIPPGSSGGRGAGKRITAAMLASYDIGVGAEPDSVGPLCSYCRSNSATSIDHVTPRSKGGDLTPRNTTPACTFCNSSKRDGVAPKNPPPNYIGRWPPPWWPQSMTAPSALDAPPRRTEGLPIEVISLRS